MPFTFDRVARLITVDSPATGTTIQEIYDTVRDYEDEPGSLDIAHIVDGAGKQELGGGELVGITLTLRNWTLRFEPRPGPDWVQCTVRGGNMTFYDTDLDLFGDPITQAAFVSVLIEKSTSPTLLSSIDITEIALLHGLDMNNPLEVNKTTRTAGGIVQTIEKDTPVPGTVRVTRTS